MAKEHHKAGCIALLQVRSCYPFPVSSRSVVCAAGNFSQDRCRQAEQLLNCADSLVVLSNSRCSCLCSATSACCFFWPRCCCCSGCRFVARSQSLTGSCCFLRSRLLLESCCAVTLTCFRCHSAGEHKQPPPSSPSAHAGPSAVPSVVASPAAAQAPGLPRCISLLPMRQFRSTAAECKHLSLTRILCSLLPSQCKLPLRLLCPLHQQLELLWLPRRLHTARLARMAQRTRHIMACTFSAHPHTHTTAMVRALERTSLLNRARALFSYGHCRWLGLLCWFVSGC